MDGSFYPKPSEYNDGTWCVMRLSYENPGSWDRLTLCDLTQAQALAIADILNGDTDV